MSEAATIKPITDDEILARFVLFSNWIRKGDHSVRQDAFIPYPWPNLSVTRHVGLSETELWEIGEVVANSRPATLYGRADIQAKAVRRESLQIEATPNPRNHANISDWSA